MSRPTRVAVPDEGIVVWGETPGERGRLETVGGRLEVPDGASLGLYVARPAALTALVPVARQVVAIEFSTEAKDEHLALLRHFTMLRSLLLSKARDVGDAGVAHLRGLARLESLDLYWTSTSDAALPHLASLASLRRLHLGMTGVRGADLTPLNGLTRLESLSLEDTRVDDAALAPLALPALKDLVLRGTRVGPEGAARFRARHPACRLIGDFEQNAERAWRDGLFRWALRILVGRVASGPSLPDAATEEEIEQALDRAFPPGTRFEAVPPGKGEWLAPFVRPASEKGFLGAQRLALWLLALPEGGSLSITRPGGESVVVPGFCTRGPDRRTGSGHDLRKGHGE